MPREIRLAGVRAVAVALVAMGIALFLATKPGLGAWAVGGPLFALGLYVHFTSRHLRGRQLLLMTLAGLLLAGLGAWLVVPAGPPWAGLVLAVVAVAALLRLPALLGGRAPRLVAWVGGRETPLLALAVAVPAWLAGRAAAGADAVLVDWMAGAACALALAALPVGAPASEWERSPGKRHEQVVHLRPDPRAADWREHVRRFVERGADAEGYAARWRRVLLRGGVAEPEADALVGRALASTPRRLLARPRADVERRRALHLELVRTLQGRRPVHAPRRQRL